MMVRSLSLVFVAAAVLVASAAATRLHSWIADPSPDREVMLNLTASIRGLKYDRSMPVCQWPNVTCDNATNVIGIRWNQGLGLPGNPGSLGGSLDLARLPPLLESLDIGGNSFAFTPRLDALPKTLRLLRIANNFLQGTTVIKNLPPALEVLDVTQNLELIASLDFLQHLPASLTYLGFGFTDFYGHADFTKLPVSLEYLVASFVVQMAGPVDLTALPPTLRRLEMNRFGNAAVPNAVDLNKLPDSLEYIELVSCNFTGHLDLDKLPRSLTYVSLSGNGFFGAIAFGNLPTFLKYLNLVGNSFTGTPDLSRAPATLVLTSNRLSGSLDFTSLPGGTKELYLGWNNFTGSVDLTRLPHSLEMLLLAGNHLEGGLDLSNLPDSFLHFDAWRNKFSFFSSPFIGGRALTICKLAANELRGSLDMTRLPATLQILDLTGNQLDFELNLSQLPQGLWALILNNNRFHGTVNMTRVPQQMSQLDLSNNPGLTTLDFPPQTAEPNKLFPANAVLWLNNDTALCGIDTEVNIFCGSIMGATQCNQTTAHPGVPGCHFSCPHC